MSVPAIIDTVNSVLSDMGRDQVNDLGQTPDAKRVESILEDTYYQMCSRKMWPSKRRLTQLDSLGDVTRATCLKIPRGCGRVTHIHYNISSLQHPEWRELIYLLPEKMSARLLGNPSDQPDIYDEMRLDEVSYRVGRVSAPTYWSSFDDEIIVTDSYNYLVEDTVQGTKTAAWSTYTPDWPTSKHGKVEIPERFYPTFTALAKATCFEKIKGQPSQSDLYWGKAGYARLLQEERINGKNKSGLRKFYGRRGPY